MDVVNRFAGEVGSQLVAHNLINSNFVGSVFALLVVSPEVNDERSELRDCARRLVVKNTTMICRVLSIIVSKCFFVEDITVIFEGYFGLQVKMDFCCVSGRGKRESCIPDEKAQTLLLGRWRCFIVHMGLNQLKRTDRILAQSCSPQTNTAR